MALQRVYVSPHIWKYILAAITQMVLVLRSLIFGHRCFSALETSVTCTFLKHVFIYALS